MNCAYLEIWPSVLYFGSPSTTKRTITYHASRTLCTFGACGHGLFLVTFFRKCHIYPQKAALCIVQLQNIAPHTTEPDIQEFETERNALYYILTGYSNMGHVKPTSRKIYSAVKRAKIFDCELQFSRSKKSLFRQTFLLAVCQK